MHASLAAQGVTPLSVQGGADVYKPTGLAGGAVGGVVDGGACRRRRAAADGVGATPPSVPRVVAALLFSRRPGARRVSSVLGVTITAAPGSTGTSTVAPEIEQPHHQPPQSSR